MYTGSGFFDEIVDSLICFWTQQSPSYLWIYHQGRNKFCTTCQNSPALYLIYENIP